VLELNRDTLSTFRAYLEERECSRATIDKYMRDIGKLAQVCGMHIGGKADLIAFKERLLAEQYAVTSINSMLSAVNRLLVFAGCESWKMRYIRVQRALFADKDREMTQKEYERMVEVAKGQRDEWLALLLQTICATGIRVSELSAITVESLKCRQARIYAKGKVRQILIPAQLCTMLMRYCKERRITSGSMFVTKNGLPLDRSNIWKMMKRLAQKAQIALQKVFPYNLRHLFACTYYEKFGDIVRLADILGHSSVNTTRIYTKQNAGERLRQINTLRLLIE